MPSLNVTSIVVSVSRAAETSDRSSSERVSSAVSSSSSTSRSRSHAVVGRVAGVVGQGSRVHAVVGPPPPVSLDLGQRGLTSSTPAIVVLRDLRAAAPAPGFGP